MAVYLTVGRLWDITRDDAATWLAGASDARLAGAAQAELLRAWEGGPEEIAFFDVLSFDGTGALLDHAARLQGLRDSTEVIERGRWRHLPYWMASHWLPVRSGRSETFGDGLETRFLGSAHTLLANLADIAAASPHDLSAIPPYFELMRTDARAFKLPRHDPFDINPVRKLRTLLGPDSFDDKTVLQWAWRGFFEAATLSVERNLPMRMG
jgi:hypothetical protein